MAKENRTVREPIEIASPGLRDSARHRLDEEDKGIASYVAANITKTREKRGWSKTDLARELSKQGWEVHRQTIHKMETMQRAVSVEDLWALAQVFRVPPESLFIRSNQEAVERLYEVAVDRRLEVVNALAFYRLAQSRLQREVKESDWLPSSARSAYTGEANYPYDELQKDSDEILEAFEMGDDL